MPQFEPPQDPKKPYFCANLRSQLAECPDTRWHAVHLFTRYFLRIGVTPSSSPVARKTKVEDRTTEEDAMDDQEALAWDFALACLASSVKVRALSDAVVPDSFGMTSRRSFIATSSTRCSLFS